MKVTVSASAPSLNASVDPRFGRCAYFMIVDTDTLQFEALRIQLNMLVEKLEYRQPKLIEFEYEGHRYYMRKLPR